MQITVSKVLSTKQLQKKDGTGMFTISQILGSDGTVGDVMGQVREGDSLEGSWEATKWGNSFRKTQTSLSFPKAGGFSKNDPETRNEIIRQHSLTAALTYATAKANQMTPDKAITYLTGRQIVQIASYFAKYSQGLLNVTMTPEEIGELYGIPNAKSDAMSDIPDIATMLDTTDYQGEQ